MSGIGRPLISLLIVQTMRFNEVPAPGTPRYNGIMIRTAMWEQLQEPAYRLLARAMLALARRGGEREADSSVLPAKRGASSG